MANTYVAISTVTVGSGGSSSIALSSIPATYTDLLLKLSLKSNRTTDYVDDFRITFNGSSTGYSVLELANYNGTVRTDKNLSASYIYLSASTASHASQTPNTFANSEVYIQNYTSSNNKSVSIDSVTEQNGTQTWQDFSAATWANSATISSITLVPDVGTLFTQYSTATLYGIKSS